MPSEYPDWLDGDDVIRGARDHPDPDAASYVPHTAVDVYFMGLWISATDRSILFRECGGIVWRDDDSVQPPCNPE